MSVPVNHDEAGARQLAQQLQGLAEMLGQLQLVGESNEGLELVVLSKDEDGQDDNEVLRVSFMEVELALNIAQCIFRPDGTAQLDADGLSEVLTWEKAVSAILKCMHDEYRRIADEANERCETVAALLAP